MNATKSIKVTAHGDGFTPGARTGDALTIYSPKGLAVPESDDFTIDALVRATVPAGHWGVLTALPNGESPIAVVKTSVLMPGENNVLVRCGKVKSTLVDRGAPIAQLICIPNSRNPIIVDEINKTEPIGDGAPVSASREDTAGQIVKVKVLREGAILPRKSHPSDAGFDLFALETVELAHSCPCMIPTGLAFEVPKGWCMTVYSRSSTALKGVIITPLIVDSGFRGEVCVIANNHKADGSTYVLAKGDRIAQVMLHKTDETIFESVETLSPSDRGENGYGSTGR